MFADDLWSSGDSDLRVDDASGVPWVFYLQQWNFCKPPREVCELTFHWRRRSSSDNEFFSDGDCMHVTSKKDQFWFVVALYVFRSNTLTHYFRWILFFFWSFSAWLLWSITGASILIRSTAGDSVLLRSTTELLLSCMHGRLFLQFSSLVVCFVSDIVVLLVMFDV